MKLLILVAFLVAIEVLARPVAPPTTRAESIGPDEHLIPLEKMNTAPTPIPDIEDEKSMDEALLNGRKVRGPSSILEEEQKETGPKPRTMKPVGPNKK